MRILHASDRRTWARTLPALTAGVILFALGAVPADDPRAWNPHHWAEWRDAQIERILTPTIETADGPMLAQRDVTQRSVDAYRMLAPLLDDPVFRGDPDRRRALDHFAFFVRGQAMRAFYDASGVHTHALGYEVSDREYWERNAPDLDFPPLLCSPDFLSRLSDLRTVTTAIGQIEEENKARSPEQRWIVLPYRSRFLKSPDKASYGRLLILVPNERMPNGDARDRWIQFSLTLPDSSKPAASVSMVSVRHSFGQTAEASLGDFMRERNRSTGETTFTPTMFLANNPSKVCYDCHKTAALPIHPAEIYTPDRNKGQGIVRDLNTRIASYGRTEIKELSTSAFGPSIGTPGRSRSDEVIRRADATLSDRSCARIRAAMNCASCHESMAPLGYPQAVSSDLGFEKPADAVALGRTYVEEGWMPPGNTLTPGERKALWRALTREYLDTESVSGTLVDWLRGAPAADGR